MPGTGALSFCSFAQGDIRTTKHSSQMPANELLALSISSARQVLRELASGLQFLISKRLPIRSGISTLPLTVPITRDI